MRINGDGWKRKRGRRSSGAFTTDTAAVMLQNGGRRAAALRDGRGGGSESTGRRNGGGGSAGRRQSGRVPPPLSRLGRTARGRGRLARWRRKRRRRLQRTAKTSAAVLQGGETAAVTRREAATWARFLFPYPLSFTGYPRSGFPLSLSREHGNITSQFNILHFKRHTRYSLLSPLYRRERDGLP